MGACRPSASHDPRLLYSTSLHELRSGDLKAALADADRGLREAQHGHSDWSWRFTALKAEILIWQGLNEQSLALLQQDFPSSLRTSDTEIWRKLTQASAYTNLSEFDKAAKSLAEAKSLSLFGHPELFGYVLLREGTLADFQGSPKQASTLYRDALRAAQENKDSYLQASALGSLGLAETEEEHYDAAVDWNREALQISEQAGAKGLVAKIRVNTGWSYFELGDYANALTMFQEAEKDAIAAGLLKDRLICRVNLGAVEYYLHDYSAAVNDSLQALQLARDLGEKRLLAESLNTLSSASIAQGQIVAAEKYNREALDASRSMKDHTGELSARLIQGRIEAERQHYRAAEALLSAVVRDNAVDTATRWESEARLAKVFDAEGNPRKAENAYEQTVRTIEQARHSVQEDELRLAFLSSAIDFYNDYVDFLIRQGKVQDALRFVDLTRSRTLAEGLASAGKVPQGVSLNLTPQRLAKKLGATLLIYWVGRAHSYLWVVTPADLSLFRLPSGLEIDPLVQAYRRDILEGHDVLASDSTTGRQLYTMLIGSANRLIRKNTHVILLPGEGLYGLNFETLIVPRPSPHFWIEDVTLSTASSMALLSAERPRPDKAGSLLLVGNPESPNPQFPSLAGATAEMQKVSAHFPESQCRVLEGNQATVGAYLASNPQRYSYLHFVTHGTASQTHPLESSIILSKEGDTYKLYAREIVAHSLRAQLVTVSACNGAGNRAFAGEGLVGLAWAFLRAGSRNVIASLWEVSDSPSTAQLMDQLYGGLDRGEDVATALRNAKLSLLKSSRDTVFRKPFYWATFQLYVGS